MYPGLETDPGHELPKNISKDVEVLCPLLLREVFVLNLKYWVSILYI